TTFGGQTPRWLSAVTGIRLRAAQAMPRQIRHRRQQNEADSMDLTALIERLEKPDAMLPCISLWQPWGSLWCSDAKEHETRHWPTSHRGWLAVHAAKRKIDDLSGERLDEI